MLGILYNSVEKNINQLKKKINFLTGLNFNTIKKPNNT